jgi:hypothetical protein
MFKSRRECSIILKLQSGDEFQVENVLPLENHNVTSDAHQPSRMENNLCFALNLIEYPLSI